jgi:choline dehydrogenase-like flavoprotein
VLNPRSRGSVRLASPDARVAPLIDPDFLSDPEDAATLLRAFRLMRRILDAPAFAPFKGRELYTDDLDADDEALVDRAIRERADTIYHPVGTCRMGADERAVVDLELRVRGVAGLRVADASVMPELVSGNTNAPTIMIGEKAADLIRRAS